jgi:YidC/Oxa1 family membrane protein insertase
MWTSFVDLIRAAIFGASHAFGGSIGGGVLLVSFAVRLGLLPWTLRLARRAMHQQQRLARLAPEIKRLQQKWAKDPARLMAATQALYKQNGIRLLDSSSFLGALAQWPLFAGLFSAVRRGLGTKLRFLWIEDLAAPNLALALLVAGASAAAASLTPQPAAQMSSTTWAVIAGGTMLIVLSTMSSTLALSIGAGSAVSALQNWILRREQSSNRLLD